MPNKIFFIVVAPANWLILLLFYPLMASANLLENPGFEDSLAPWNTFGTNVFFDTSMPLSGTGHIKQFGQFPGDSVTQQVVPADEGLFYQLVINAKTPTADSIVGTSNFYIGVLDFLDTGGDVLLSVATSAIVDGSSIPDLYFSQSILGIAPTGTTSAQVTLVFVNPVAEGGSVFADEISLNVVPEPSASALLGLGLFWIVGLYNKGTKKKRIRGVLCEM